MSSLSLSEIETLAQNHARDDGFNLISGGGLVITNWVYRRLVAARPWDDFNITDSTLSTEENVGVYAWLVGPVFTDVRAIRVQDWEDADEFKLIVPVRSMQTWNKKRREPNGFPEVYRRYIGVNGLEVIEFRPTPSIGGQTIEIEGIVEPMELLSANDSTDFKLKGIDEAFALILAGFYLAKKGTQARATQLFGMAAEQIRANTGKEISAKELGELITD